MAGFDMRAKNSRSSTKPIYTIALIRKNEASFVTNIFELTGHISTVEVKTYAPVSNHWIYLNYALINQDTGQAWDFGRELSYYYGYDQRRFLERREAERRCCNSKHPFRLLLFAD